MENNTFLETMGIMVAAATIVVLLARPLHVPSIVASLIAGILVGPVFGLIELAEGAASTKSIKLVGEVGIVLLLFLVGLELSLARLRDIGRVAVVAGLGQVVFTAIGGFGIAIVLGFDVMSSIFLATALTFSSTVVVVKLLDQKGEITSLYGRIAVGIFLVQDLVVIVILTLLAGLGDPETMTPASMALGVGKAFLGMAALLVIVHILTRYVLPRPLGFAARSPETLLVWSLAWCFLCVLAAEHLSLSPEIGAFLAGVGLAQQPSAHALLRRVQPLMNYFVAIFFVSLGARMELGAALDDWGASLALSLFVLIGNPLIFMLIIVRQGYDRRTAFLTSVTVAQISEFSFIFVAMGVSAGLVESRVMSITALVGFATIVVSSYMIVYNHPLYRFVARLGLLRPFRPKVGGKPPEEPPPAAELPEGHVVIVGLTALGSAIAEHLHARGDAVLAVDIDEDRLHGLPYRVVHGDIDEDAVFHEAAIPRARAVIGCLRGEESMHLLAWRCRRAATPFALEASGRRQLMTARTLGFDSFVNTRDLAATELIDHVRDLLGHKVENGGTP